MGRFLHGILVATTLALATPAAGADETFTLAHQGTARSATLHRPSVPADGPLPVVVALQGLGQSTRGLRETLQLDAVADREAFVVVYPEAIEKSWSYGRSINQPMPMIENETVDDIGFIRRLTDDLIGRKIADPSRIYVTGMSRGGLMAFTLACTLAGQIAGAAPLLTGMTEFQRADCNPTRPVPLLVIAGTSDFIQSFGGAQGVRGRLLSVPETMDYWRTVNGCTRRASSSRASGFKRPHPLRSGRVEQLPSRCERAALPGRRWRTSNAVDCRWQHAGCAGPVWLA